VDALLDAAPAGVRSQILDRIATVKGVLEVGGSGSGKPGTATLRTFRWHWSAISPSSVRAGVRCGEVAGARGFARRRRDGAYGSTRPAHGKYFRPHSRRGYRFNFNVHDVSVQDLNGQLHVEQHLELDEQLSMKQAHDEVTRLETEMRTEIPEIATILTHIESEPRQLKGERRSFASPNWNSAQGYCEGVPE